MAKKKIDGFEVTKGIPEIAARPRDKHADVRRALGKLSDGEWLVVPVSELQDMEHYRIGLLQNLRTKRTGWKLTTRIDRTTRKLFIARVA